MASSASLFSAANAGAHQDPHALQQQLDSSRHACQQSIKECQALRTTVRSLEQTITLLQSERTDLRLQIKELRATDVRLTEEAQRLREQVEKHQLHSQRVLSEHAARVVASDSRHSDQLAKLHRRIELLTVQLALTQSADFEQKPLTWFRMSKVEHHPVHTIRDVVLSDAKREEMLRERGSAPRPGSDHAAAMALELDELLVEPMTDEQRASQDDSAWRAVARRLHLVLSARRTVLHLNAIDGPVEFLLRTRSMLVAQLCQLHADINRCNVVMVALLSHLDLALRTTGQVGIGDLERHLDVACSILSDLDVACHRSKAQCFSDVDRVVHAGAATGYADGGHFEPAVAAATSPAASPSSLGSASDRHGEVAAGSATPRRRAAAGGSSASVTSPGGPGRYNSPSASGAKDRFRR